MIHYLDFIGAIFAFISTIAYIRISPLAWPIGLIAIGIDIFLYWQKGIYGDMALQSIYLSMTFYGWYSWLFGGINKSELPITSLTPILAKLLAITAVIATTITFILLKELTNSQIPLLDATTTILSLIAQWLICRKIIQCWHLWFIIDALYCGLYIFKGIPAHASLQIMYLGMAIAGYYSWRKQKKGQITTTAVTIS